MPGWPFKIQGGIVFTHPEVTLDIDPRIACPVHYGDVNWWINKIRQTSANPFLSEDQLLMALDILMTYSSHLFYDKIFRSVPLADRAYAQQAQKFIQWREGKGGGAKSLPPKH
jgi:hypothetical protein